MPGYLLLLFLVAGVCGLVNRGKGRRVVNSFKIAAWAVGVVFLADLALAFYLINQKGISDGYWQGRLVGGVLAGALIPLILAIVLAQRAAKDVPPPLPPAS